MAPPRDDVALLGSLTTLFSPVPVISLLIPLSCEPEEVCRTSEILLGNPDAERAGELVFVSQREESLT